MAKSGLTVPHVLFCIGLAITSYPVMAQDAPAVRKGTTELGVFLGSSYGADEFRVMGGGNVSYAVTKWLLPYGEFSYFPGLPRQQGQPNLGDKGSGGGVANYDVPLSDFHGGVHIRVPIREKRFVPYGVFGLGVVHNYKTTIHYKYKQDGAATMLDIPVTSANYFAINFGGGIRYYINQKYGFRVEAKVYRVDGGLKSPIDGYFSKYEFGFFYQIH
jgi:hypothetical protein